MVTKVRADRNPVSRTDTRPAPQTADHWQTRPHPAQQIAR
jgi:hypothetical protein